MLSLQGIDSFYGASQAIHGLSVEAESANILSVLGRNGVGKSTLLKTVMGLTDRSVGSVRLDGKEIGGEPTHRRARRGIAYVPQGREIVPDFSIRQNIVMGAFARADGRSEIPPEVPELFPYLMENLERPGGVLSGGQQQQLAIARALAARPKVLLLDEPTEGIQPNIVEQLEETIQALNQRLGLTILLVEQNVRFARQASQAYVILEKGRDVAKGSIDQLSDELVHRHLTV